MKKNYSAKNVLRTTLIVASLTAGFGINHVNAATSDETEPQAHSDGVSAAITDTVITAKVQAKLAGESGLKKSDISVTTTNGVVILDGSAHNADAKALAETLTKLVDGVKSVDNNLKVPANTKAEANTRDAIATGERAVSDSWITTKVKSEILADNVSKGFNVNVVTKHGVVVLKGTLATQDGIDHVKDIAAKVKGVKSVDTSGLTVSSN